MEAVSPDTWEFKLRPDVKFSDGTPFTADDVAFSYNRALAPTSDFRSYISSIKEVKAIDPLTVHIITNGPNPILPDYTDLDPDHVQGVGGEAQRHQAAELQG